MDAEKAFDKIYDKLSTWLQEFIVLLPNLVVAIFIIISFWILAKGVQKLAHNLLSRISPSQQINNLIGKILYVAVLAIGLFIALGAIGLEKTVTSLLAGAGIIGLALGFAFQDLSENLIAGIYMAVRRPFKVTDLIDTNDHFGTVETVSLRSTRMRTLQGQLIIMPNKQIFQNPITNYTTNGKRRVDLSVGVSYGDDLEKAARIATEAVEAIETRDKERDVELFYEAFGDSSINFTIRFWIDFAKQPDYLAARSQAVINIKKAFDENDITIPFPIRTLDFGIVGGEKLSAMLPGQQKTPTESS